MSTQAGGTPPSVSFCITHKAKLTTPELKAAHMMPDCLVYDPPGIDTGEVTSPLMVDSISTEPIGTSTYEEMVYPSPSPAVASAKKQAGEQI